MCTTFDSLLSVAIQATEITRCIYTDVDYNTYSQRKSPVPLVLLNLNCK